MKKRFATLLTAFSLIVSSSTVFGQQITTQPEAPIDVPVSANIASNYVITLPVNIEIGESREAAYNVAVSGDVTQNTVISVAPESTFDLTSDLRTVTASVTQNKTEWDATDCESGVQENGTISATGLKAGHWTGSLIFDIAITVLRDPGLYNAGWQLVTPWDQLVSDGVIHQDENGVITTNYSSGSNPSASTLVGNLVISQNATSIGEDAFEYCAGLTNVVIPDGVTSIGGYAFYGCSSLESIVIPDGVTSIETGAFQRCSGLSSINIPNGATKIGDGAFAGCISLSNIDIPISVTSIGNGAFSNCSRLTSVTIPDGITSIGMELFKGCTELSDVTIPASVTGIKDAAFYGCTSLSNINIPDGVTKIGTSAFYSCTSLQSVKVPDSVTKIEGSAFKNCTSLTSVSIPSSVTNIGSEAFSDCSNMTDFRYSGSKEQWGRIVLWTNWSANSAFSTVHCSDGDVTL